MHENAKVTYQQAWKSFKGFKKNKLQHMSRSLANEGHMLRGDGQFGHGHGVTKKARKKIVASSCYQSKKHTKHRMKQKKRECDDVKEQDTSKTCPMCARPTMVSGPNRIRSCSNCHAVFERDAIGASNITKRALDMAYAGSMSPKMTALVATLMYSLSQRNIIHPTPRLEEWLNVT